MNNKEGHQYQNRLENPDFSEALDKIIQESKERLKQKRYHQNKNDDDDDDQIYNIGNDQNDNTNSDDYSCCDYIISSCQ